MGVFKKIQKHLNLDDIRETVLPLSVGKLTTDPENHSGEGIFFSSRIFDRFVITSNGLAYIRDNSKKTGLLRTEITQSRDRRSC